MFGSSITNLTLFRNGTTEILWRKTGNQGNQWYEATVPVIAGTTTLRFRVVGDGSSFTSDIALDHIRIYSKLNKLAYDPNIGLSLTGNITATSGIVGGFEIGGDFLRAGADNTKLLLKHDVTNPFLSIGQLTQEYNQNGIFLGFQSANPKFSLIKDSSTFFKYDPSLSSPLYNLEISGNAKIGPLFVNNIDSSSELRTIANGKIFEDLANNIQIDAPPTDTGKFYFNSDGTMSQTINKIYFQVTQSGSPNSSILVKLYKNNILISTQKTQIISNSVTIENLSFFTDRIDITLSAQITGQVILNKSSIQFYTYKPIINLNNLAISSNGDITSPSLLLGIENQDKIKIIPENIATDGYVIEIKTPESALTDSRIIRLPDATGTVALTSTFLQTATLLGSVSRGATNAMNDTGATATITNASTYPFILLRLFAGAQDSNGWLLIPESVWDNSTTQTHTLEATRDNYQTVYSIVQCAVERESDTSIRVFFSYSNSADDILEIYGVS
jgi:hypothetical protein